MNLKKIISLLTCSSLVFGAFLPLHTLTRASKSTLDLQPLALVMEDIKDKPGCFSTSRSNHRWRPIPRGSPGGMRHHCLWADGHRLDRTIWGGSMLYVLWAGWR